MSDLESDLETRGLESIAAGFDPMSAGIGAFIGAVATALAGWKWVYAPMKKRLDESERLVAMLRGQRSELVARIRTVPDTEPPSVRESMVPTLRLASPAYRELPR